MHKDEKVNHEIKKNAVFNIKSVSCLVNKKEEKFPPGLQGRDCRKKERREESQM